MRAKRIDPRRIKKGRTYSVEETARTLAIHKNTVRGWTKSGLVPIDARRPILFLGAHLREFLEKRSVARMRPCGPGKLYCLKCRKPRVPAMDMVDWVTINERSGNLKAICGVCGTMMHRRAARDTLAKIMPGIEVQFPEGQPRLNGSGKPSLICDSRQEAR